MAQQKILQILTGAGKVAKSSAKALASTSSEILTNHLRDKYVAQEEFNQLKRLVLSLEQKIQELNNNRKG